MRLEFESGTIIDSPTETDLLNIDGEGFAILSRSDGVYLQCAEENEPPSEYVLEYQEGSLEEHFNAVDAPITLQRVLVAFRKYLHGDPSWKDDFRWERMDLS